jgi:hypothetical protein
MEKRKERRRMNGLRRMYGETERETEKNGLRRMDGETERETEML